MTLTADLALVERALNSLERREVRVLVWGLIDSALSAEEVEDSLEEVLRQSVSLLSAPSCTIATSGELRRRMLAEGLLFEVPRVQVTAPARFRTRMGEGIRLLARLRQLFPHRHDGRDGWIAAPTLVADYRLLWRPRRYPRRDISALQALDGISQNASATALEAVRHWLGKADPGWTLARFQIDATRRILEGLEAGTPRGTIVAAGTGSGKTLAFYLPALAWLAAQKRAHPGSGGVRVIALYPRNELLKDQLLEVFGQSRKFDDFLGRASATGISVGVLYGDTPETVGSATTDWQKSRGICPFFRCPKCKGEMRLAPGATKESDARLLCGCGAVVSSDVLRITRKSMREDPPDVLFTSVEMLNQRMADSSMRHLFGLGPQALRIPALMLLDEVHVYSSTYGAQVAHLIRRWSALTGHRTGFVGLSATIAEGKAFFAAMTNMDAAAVEEIAPAHEDMVDEGAEYMLALRGDPVSQAALLSTSIQTLMLAARLMERRQDFDGGERPFAGWRAFAFTDQMDATNRLFYDLRDAEGRTKDGIPATGKYPNGGLAQLRVPGPSLRRYEGGQDWRLIPKIGHALDTRLQVGRTTAYDSGVDGNAEIIVATAALEVGYDDPAVGVVVQHKAPRDLAQFVQRKGRAGRSRHMRPWTIMVLSDYGRDRLAYQAYEQFFDPELPPRELPLSNRYVRRMQAVYALVDYLGVCMQVGEPKGSVWRDLSAPKSYPVIEQWPDQARTSLRALVKEVDFPLAEKAWKSLKSRARNLAPARPVGKEWEGANWIESRLRRTHLVRLLRDLLKDPEKTEALARFVCVSLDLTRDEVAALLWDHPRPLLLGAIPTALRRLATDWRAHGLPQMDRAAGNPLPEFAPATLFSDLSLPEVRLVVPPPGAQEDRYLPVTQALSELAPGKVSRRLDKPLWLGPAEAELIGLVDAGESVVDIDIGTWYLLDPQTPVQVVENGSVVALDAYRPLDFNLAVPPSSKAANHLLVQDSSNARLHWRSQLFGRRAGARFVPPHSRVAISRLVRHVTVFTHQSQSPATVRRYAVDTRVDLRIQRALGRLDYAATWRFTKDGRPCGVGFEMEVDALCFTLDLPERIAEVLRENPGVQRAARSARYVWEAVHGDGLVGVEGNPFLRMWLSQIFQVAAVALASERDCPLAEALEAFRSPTETHRLAEVLTTIFQSSDVPDQDVDIAEDLAGVAGASNGSSGATLSTEPRLKQRLVAALGQTEVIDALMTVAQRTLTAPFDEAWTPWLASAIRDTLGAALMEAVQQTCPQIDTGDLIVDIDPGPNEAGNVRPDSELWISEANPGGNGLIEQLVEVLAHDSSGFYRRVEAALQPSEFELIDVQLCDVIRRIGTDPVDQRLRDAMQAIRSSPSSSEAQQRLADLRRLLIDVGHAVFHGYVSALSTRMLRPGSPPALDALLARLIERWENLEARLGVEVDARVICAVFSNDHQIDKAFVAAGFELPAKDRETWRFSVLMGLMWARGHALRANALPLNIRFSDTPAVTERLLLLGWLTPPETPIAATGPDWLERLHQRLVTSGSAAVSVSHDPARLSNVIARLVTVPVQLEYLNVYPRLTSAERRPGEIRLHLTLEATL